jgi:hypothetical protein
VAKYNWRTRRSLQIRWNFAKTVHSLRDCRNVHSTQEPESTESQKALQARANQHGNPLAHLRRRVETKLTAEISKAGPGVRDILRLGRTKMSERCDVVLELSFSNDNDDHLIVGLSL